MSKKAESAKNQRSEVSSIKFFEIKNEEVLIKPVVIKASSLNPKF